MAASPSQMPIPTATTIIIVIQNFGDVRAFTPVVAKTINPMITTTAMIATRMTREPKMESIPFCSILAFASHR
jgi:hypothetical protein